MSTAQERLLDRFRARLNDVSPDVMDVILQAWQKIANSFTPGELRQLIAEGGVDHAIAVLLSTAKLDELFLDVRAQVRLQAQNAVAWSASEVPKRGRRAGTLLVQFNVLNPKHLAAVDALDTKVINVLENDVRESFRAFLSIGIEDGTSPFTLAREIKDWIGLSENQVNAVLNFEQMLIAGDREALTREWRDKRFDRSLDRALGVNGDGATKEEVEKWTAAYLEGALQGNANTLARTATLEALKIGNQMAWQEAQAKGFVPEGKIMKRWLHLDGQDNPRPEHEAMQGEVVPFDEPYSNGDMYAGEGDPWNCHCRDMVFVDVGL